VPTRAQQAGPDLVDVPGRLGKIIREHKADAKIRRASDGSSVGAAP
jgi:hypothetical protein